MGTLISAVAHLEHIGIVPALAAPLMAGNDLRTMSDETRSPAQRRTR